MTTEPAVAGRLTVSLLGPPQVERDGSPVEVDTRKAIALLSYLVMTPGGLRRDTLAALLWPEYSQERAKAALRRTLSVLRKALDGGWLAVERGQVAVMREDLSLDVEVFRERATGCDEHTPSPRDECRRCLAAAAEAASLYRGDFMAGFSLRDSASFDDWQSYEADGFRRELAGVLERLVRGFGASGEAGSAIGAARRWLQLDPLSENAHRELMLLYSWTGDRTSALRQYRDCVSILEQELGVSPLAETTELYQAIREDRPPPAPERPEPEVRLAPAQVASRILPLVGRGNEWSRIEAAYQGIDSDGRFVVIEGEAGIGKTRLVGDMLADLGAKGTRTLVARCHSDESGIAYGPVIALLNAAGEALGAVPEVWLSEVGRLIPEAAGSRAVPAPAPLDEPGARVRFFEGIAGALVAGAQGPAPGVLVVDDLQWADEASVEVLAYLVRRLVGRPVCVIGTWRTEDVDDAHPLRRLLVQGRRDGVAVHVRLARLGAADVRALVDVASPDAPASLGEMLWEETEGLPFFVVEYLASLADEGGASSEIPKGVRDLLRSRLDPLSQPAWHALSTGAVIGRSFDLDVLRDASGRSEEEVVAAMEELLRRGLVEVASDGPHAVYDFTHEKVRAFVYEETSLARRRLLHRRVAEAMRRRRHDATTLSALIAHHYLQSGDDVQAAEQFRLAGEHARALSANAEALAHLREALALGHADPAPLHEAIGDLLTLAGEYPDAIRSYETAAAMSPVEHLPVLEHKLGLTHHRRGDWDAADSYLESALAGSRDDPARRARVLADRSLNAHRAGRQETAVALAGQALATASAADDPAAVAQAHNMAGVLASRRGDLEEARDHLQRSLAIAEQRSDTTGRVAALNNLALTARASGDLSLAVDLTRRALELCTAQGDRHRQAALHNNLADLHQAVGDTDVAMEHLKEAVAIFADIGEPGTMEPEIWKLVQW